MHVFEFSGIPEYHAIANHGGGAVYAGPDFAHWLVGNRLLTEVARADAGNGDLVFYFSAGEFRHAGLLRANGRVVSKWGTGNLYDHELFEVPESYGTDVRYYKRLPRERALPLFTRFAQENGVPSDVAALPTRGHAGPREILNRGAGGDPLESTAGATSNEAEIGAPLSVSECLAHSTVRIECDSPAGATVSGTGFFYRFADNAVFHVPAIVTNKRLVDGAAKIRICVALADANGKPAAQRRHVFELSHFERMWIPHPEPDVDLCAMPISPLLQEAARMGKTLLYIPLDKSFVPTRAEMDDLAQMEEITVVGFPNGMWDQLNNMPVFRRSISATHPNLDWNGQPAFLIDTACPPGSSGSPVFLFNLNGYETKSRGLVAGPGRVKLLGVLRAGVEHANSNNLGIAIKATKLEIFESIFGAMLAAEQHGNPIQPPTPGTGAAADYKS